MDANIARAAGAYQSKNNLMEGIVPTADLGQAEKAPTFSDMLGEVLQDAVDTGVKAEKMQLGALTGEVELADLVTAIAEAEVTLNTVVTVRDKVISAYQEIIRMPV